MGKQGPEGPDQDATGDRAEPSNSGGATDAARGQDAQVRRTSVKGRLAGAGSDARDSGTGGPRPDVDDATEELQAGGSGSDEPQAAEPSADETPDEQGAEDPTERDEVQDRAEQGAAEDLTEQGEAEDPADQGEVQDPGDPPRTDERAGSDAPTVITQPA